MTLIVSLRTADGVVIAGDSLSTMRRRVPISADVPVECTECGHSQTIEDHHVQEIELPASTFSFEQKVFPFMGRFGVGTFGAARLRGHTPYFAIRQLERELNRKGDEPAGIHEAAKLIAEHTQEELRKENEGPWEQIPDGWRPLGFQIAGYTADGEALSVMLAVGKTVDRTEFGGFGCSKSGTGRAVEAIWKSYGEHKQDQAAYAAFSLQDAIDYAKFLISTEASYQRFSSRIADVGGDVDVGLVTPYEGFTWIHQKKLGKILAGSDSIPGQSKGDADAENEHPKGHD